MNRTERSSIALLSFCSVILLSFSDIGAQTAATSNPLGPFAESLGRRLAEQDLRGLPLKLRERRERNLADPKVRAQMNEDFVRIQVIRGDIVKTFSAGALLTPSELQDFADEVKDRASRLRSMLALSEGSDIDEPKLERSKTIESLNDHAYKLCLEISRFTENPIFKSKGSVSARHSNEADRTLGLVVFLAAAVQKDSKRISKK